MRSRTIFLLVTMIIFSTACSSAIEIPETSTSQPPSPTVTTEPPTETPLPTAAEPIHPPTEEFISECTLVSSLPDPSAEYAGVFEVKEDDWVSGPADASITLIEYGDFQ